MSDKTELNLFSATGEKITIKKPLLSKFIELSRRSVALYSTVSFNPPIFYAARFTHLETVDSIISLKPLFDYFKECKVYFLYAWYNYVEREETVKRIKQIEDQHSHNYPNFEFVHLCNTLSQLEIFQRFGMNAIYCNHNALVDETIYKPIPAIEKRFDAVYDARLVKFKRHFLAAKISNLALIYYNHRLADSANYIETVKKQFLPDAHYFNHQPAGKYRILDSSEINKCLNACRVGLCLSEEEGAMYASIQYLLAGLPVVTTDSRGGRDVFFEEPYVMTVAANLDAVCSGVEEMISRRLSPQFIRQRTIEKIVPHRLRFASLIQGIYAREGCERNFRDEWKNIFFDKMLKNQSHVKTFENFSRVKKEIK